MRPSIIKVTLNLIVLLICFSNGASSLKGQPFAYVVNSTSNSVSVIDTETNSVVDSVIVGDGPKVVEFTPNGAFAYVTNFDSGTVSVIDTETNPGPTVVDTVTVGTNPKGIDVTPDGAFVYVANRGSGNVSVIETETNTVVKTINVDGTRAHEIDIASDGAFAYVTTSSNNTHPGKLSVIDTDPASMNFNTVVDTVPIGVFPVGVAVTPNQSLVFAVNNVSNTVSVIETVTNTVVKTIGISGARPEGIAITPDGALAYVTQTTLDSVVVISTVAPYVIVDTIQVSSGPIDVAFTPDGSLAYVSNQQSGTVSVIDTATNSVVDSVMVEIFPRGVAIAPLPVDQDEDGLTDDEEANLGTDPNDPDTDDDGLFDGTEVDMAQGSGCPNPLDSDSDDDTLLDGEEVALGTMPCNPDSDGDGIPDHIDPFPLDPEGTSGFIEDELRNLGNEVLDLDISLIDANNQNAAQGRINALSNKAIAAANAVAAGDIEEAIDQLNSLLQKVDGDSQPKDWLVDSAEKDLIANQIANLIVLLELL